MQREQRETEKCLLSLPAAGGASRLRLLSVAPRDIREDFQAVDKNLVALIVVVVVVGNSTPYSVLQRASSGCSLGPNDVPKAQQERFVVVAGADDGALEGGRGQTQLPLLLVSCRPDLGVSCVCVS